MSTGLLWFDADPTRPLAAKVTDAAERFAAKFGVTPDTCQVSKRMLTDEIVVPFRTGQIKVVPDHNILVNHFWVGREVAA